MARYVFVLLYYDSLRSRLNPIINLRFHTYKRMGRVRKAIIGKGLNNCFIFVSSS